jgi:hypothetical protein
LVHWVPSTIDADKLASALYLLLLEIKIPRPFEEVREGSWSHENELVENVRQQCAVMHLEEDACFAHETQDLPQDEPSLLHEQRVQDGVQQFGVQMRWVLLQENMVLDAEMRCQVREVDVLGHHVHSDDLLVTEDAETLEHCFLRDGLVDVLDHFLAVI